MSGLKSLTIGSWGKRYAAPRREVALYEVQLRKAVMDRHGAISHEHLELIQLAVRAEYLSRCVMVDVRWSLDGKDEERVFHKARLDAMKQQMYFTKERILAVRQLGLVDAEVRSASGRDGDPFAEVDAAAQGFLDGEEGDDEEEGGDLAEGA